MQQGWSWGQPPRGGASPEDWTGFADTGGFGPGQGGRVPDAGPNTGPPAPFQLFSEQPGGSEGAAAGGAAGGAGAYALDSLAHTQMPSAVARLFLSPANVGALQDGIRYRVWVESSGRHVIGRQSDVELAVVMRSVLLREGRNDPGRGAVEQVRELNASVLAFCVPRIVAEADMYAHYRRDVSTLPVPLERGGLATSKGDRTLVMRDFF